MPSKRCLYSHLNDVPQGQMPRAAVSGLDDLGGLFHP